MLNNTQLYFFSPTGGTKAYGQLFSKALSENVVEIDLGSKDAIAEPEADLAVFALPVFGGRIPELTADKIKALKGEGKKAVTIVVYGTRAYEDALLELNDVAQAAGFDVVASAAVVAQHSIVPEIGQGRPDKDDEASIADFAKKVLEKLEKEDATAVTVPGNSPYKDMMSLPATPICLPECGKCGNCVTVCPTDAITIDDEGVKTDTEKCILCMACAAACPTQARILPPPLQKNMSEMMAALLPVRRENEYFL